MKNKKFFLLTWKKLWIIVVTGFVSIILHNLISGLINTEEVIFFTITVFIIHIYFLIAVSFSAVNYFKKRKTKKS